MIDDAAAVRARLGAMLAEIPGVTGVLETAGVAEAVEALGARAPGTVLIDVHLRGESGLVMVPFLKRCRSDPRLIVPLLIVMTSDPTEALRRQALALGADHFFDKSRDVEDLLRVVAEAAAPTRALERSDG